MRMLCWIDISATLAAGVLSGCALFQERQQTTMRIHEEVPSVLPEKRAMPISLHGFDVKLSVDPHPALSEKDLQSAELYPTAGGAAILLRLNKHGMFALEEITTRLRGRRLVTFLNGRPVAVWLVNQRITNGQLLIEGDFTEAEAQSAVDALNRLSKKWQ